MDRDGYGITFVKRMKSNNGEYLQLTFLSLAFILEQLAISLSDLAPFKGLHCISLYCISLQLGICTKGIF